MEGILNDIFSLEGQTVLLTGGYGHLGRAAAIGLAAHGATVIVLGRHEEKFHERFAGCSSSIHFQACDISQTASIHAAFKVASARTGRIDALINNAFYCRGNDPEQLTDDDWAYSIDGTLNSVYRATREVIPYFKTQRAGRIVNVSSMYGMVSPNFTVYEQAPEQLNPPHYGAAKAGVIQLTRYYAAYLARYGVNVNCVTAGPFPSENTQRNVEFIEELKSMNPMRAIGKPEDIVGAFVFLCSPASGYVTGHNLVVDGGWTAW